jgi:hypothetical protein
MLMIYFIQYFHTIFRPLMSYYNFIIIFNCYGVMGIQLTTFVYLNFCDNITLNMAAIATEKMLQL